MLFIKLMLFQKTEYIYHYFLMHAFRKNDIM